MVYHVEMWCKSRMERARVKMDSDNKRATLDRSFRDGLKSKVREYLGVKYNAAGQSQRIVSPAARHPSQTEADKMTTDGCNDG